MMASNGHSIVVAFSVEDDEKIWNYFLCSATFNAQSTAAVATTELASGCKQADNQHKYVLEAKKKQPVKGECKAGGHKKNLMGALSNGTD